MSDAAGKVQIVLSVDKATYSQAMTEAQRQLDTFAGKAKSAGAAHVSSMQASSAAIRELNGDFTNNIRAVERFITTIPGVGNALKAAFPLVGGIAFGAMIVEAGIKVADFIKKVNAMPKALSDGFASLHLAAMSTSDALHLTNDELRNSIDKLQGKPQNNLAIQLDEARLNADALATSLENDAKKFKDLLAANQISSLGGLLTGQGGTEGVSGAAKSYFADIQHLGNVYAQAVHEHPGDAKGNISPEAKKALADLKAKQDSALKWAKSELFISDNPDMAGPNDRGVLGDQAGNRAILLGFQDMITSQQSRQQDESDHGSLSAQQKKLTGDKALADAQKEAARKQLELQKQSMSEVLDAMKADHQVSVTETLLYWQKQVDVTKQGTELYKFALSHYAEANQEWYRALAESERKSDEDAKKKADAIARWDELAQRLIDQTDEETAHIAEAMAKLSDATAKSTFETNSLARAHDLATGAITAHDAAIQAAADHAADYAAQISALQTAKDKLSDRDIANGKGTNLDAQMVSVTGQRDRTAASDQWNIQNSTGVGGFKSAIDEFIAASRDGARQMHDLVTGTLSNLNTQLVNGMMGKRMDLKSVGSTAFRSIASTSLQRGESSLLGAFGMGKLGTKSNPMAVQIVSGGGVGGAAGKAISSVAGGTLGKLGGVFGGLLKAVLPGFADGGYIDGPAIVGERGPELFMPSGSGTIVPNHQLAMAGGGDIHFHPGAIDARGAHDPAAVDAAVQRGIRAAAPHLVNASVQAGASPQCPCTDTEARVMSRNLETTYAATLSAPVIWPIRLVQIAFRSQTTYIWSGPGPLTWDGHTFIGTGSLGKISAITEAIDVQANGVTVSLSGIDPVLLGEAMTDIQVGATARIWRGAYEPNVGLVGTPYQLFRGQVDKPTVDVDASSLTITLALESRIVNLQRASNRRYTSADQRLEYATDSAFGWVETLNDIALVWG